MLSLLGQRNGQGSKDDLKMTQLMTQLQKLDELMKNKIATMNSTRNSTEFDYDDEMFGNMTGFADIMNGSIPLPTFNETAIIKGLEDLDNWAKSLNSSSSPFIIRLNSSHPSMNQTEAEDELEGGVLNVVVSMFIVMFTGLIMITFAYYIPRMLYVRLSRFSTDYKQKNFVLLFYLSMVSIAGPMFHILAFRHSVASNPLVAMMMDDQLSMDTYFYDYFYDCMKASFNRVASPICAIYLFQQFATYKSSLASIGNVINNKGYQLVFCLLTTAIVFSITFAFGNSNYEEAMMTFKYVKTQDFFPLDFAPPLLAAALLFMVRFKVSRQELYTDSREENAPNSVDLVSKAVTYQFIVTVITIVFGLLAHRKSGSSLYSAIANTQTVTVHWVLMRSLLRSRRSTKPCFLFCCGPSPSVRVDNTPPKAAAIEMRGPPRAGKEALDEKQDQNTQETLEDSKAVEVKI